MSQGLMGFDDKSLSEALDGWMDGYQRQRSRMMP